MTRRPLYLITSAIIALAAMLTGAAALASNMPVLRNMGTADGLSDLLVNTIYKDADGYVWFGTGAGVDRFDGNNIRNYSFPAENSQPSRVHAITSGPDGRLYVGNYQGLYCLEQPDAELVQILPDVINCSVNALVFDGNHTLYAGTTHGLYAYDTATGQSTHTLLRPDMLSQDNEVSAMTKDDARGLWLTTYSSLYHLDTGSGALQRYPVATNGAITTLTDTGDMLYMGTLGGGMLRFDTKAGRFLDPVAIGNNIITAISIMPDGSLLIATDGEGIFKWSPVSGNILSHSTQAEGDDLKLSSNSVYSMLLDTTPLLWLGYYQQGVDYTPYSSGLLETYCVPGIIDTGNLTVRSLAIHGSQKLIGTREGLYFIDEANGRHATFRTPGIRSNIIFSILYRNNRYYVGTYGGGMYVFNPASMSLTDFDSSRQPFRSESIFALTADSDGNMWAGTSRGLFRFNADDRETAHFNSLNSQLPAGNVYDIFFDSTGRGWICTENGMAIWIGSELHADRFPKDFPGKLKIRDIFEDASHRLYFVPDRGNVFTSNLELTETAVLPTPETSSGMTTTFIEQDRDGWMWAGTDKGLVRFNNKGTFHLYGKSDGLRHQVFTLCPPVYDDKGNMWIGNSRGLVKVDFALFDSTATTCLRETVTEISTDGRSIIGRVDHSGDIPSVTLRDKENNITVKTSDFTFSDPRHRLVEYILEGYDSRWNCIRANDRIIYYNLPRGEYTLRVRPLGHSELESAMTVRVQPGINWLLIAAILIVVMAFAAVTSAYLRHRRKSETLHRQAIEAGAEAEKKKQQRYKTTRISNEECKRLLRALDKLMKTRKPYTNPELKLADLAAMVDTSAHALSFLFNQYMNKSYYDYVNQYRVEEFIDLAERTDVTRYTLSAMAAKCGFSSRASFFRYFKNITGITPAEYLKKRL